MNYEDFSALRSAVFSSGGNVMFVDSDENNNVPELDVSCSAGRSFRDFSGSLPIR